MAAWAFCCPHSMQQEETRPDPAGTASNGIRKAKIDTGDGQMPWRTSRNHRVMLVCDVFPNLEVPQSWALAPYLAGLNLVSTALPNNLTSLTKKKANPPPHAHYYCQGPRPAVNVEGIKAFLLLCYSCCSVFSWCISETQELVLLSVTAWGCKSNEINGQSNFKDKKASGPAASRLLAQIQHAQLHSDMKSLSTATLNFSSCLLWICIIVNTKH